MRGFEKWTTDQFDIVYTLSIKMFIKKVFSLAKICMISDIFEIIPE